MAVQVRTKRMTTRSKSNLQNTERSEEVTSTTIILPCEESVPSLENTDATDKLSPESEEIKKVLSIVAGSSGSSKAAELAKANVASTGGNSNSGASVPAVAAVTAVTVPSAKGKSRFHDYYTRNTTHESLLTLNASLGPPTVGLVVS